MSDAVLPARSRYEIELYLKLAQCPQCGRSEFDLTPTPPSSDSTVSVEFLVACKSCGAPVSTRFQISGMKHDRSRLIDASQWLTLYGLMVEAARNEKNKSASRQLAMQAASCLNEALRFYDEENDLPPENAFFTDDSRARFRQHPQLFSRQRLLNLRAQLPTPSKFDANNA